MIARAIRHRSVLICCLSVPGGFSERFFCQRLVVVVWSEAGGGGLKRKLPLTSWAAVLSFRVARCNVPSRPMLQSPCWVVKNLMAALSGRGPMLTTPAFEHGEGRMRVRNGEFDLGFTSTLGHTKAPI